MILTVRWYFGRDAVGVSYSLLRAFPVTRWVLTRSLKLFYHFAFQNLFYKGEIYWSKMAIFFWVKDARMRVFRKAQKIETMNPTIIQWAYFNHNFRLDKRVLHWTKSFSEEVFCTIFNLIKNILLLLHCD